MEYNLTNYRELASHRKLTSRYGLEIVNYKPSQIWKNVPMEIGIWFIRNIQIKN